MQHTDLYGEYVGRDFSHQDLRGATLGGRFIGCDFSKNDLTGARLVGDFINCTFNASVRRAHQEASLITCEEV